MELGMGNGASKMLHKCSTTELQPHPKEKRLGRHSTRVPFSHSLWNSAERLVMAEGEKPTHQNYETQGHSLPVSLQGKIKAVLTINEQGNGMAKKASLFLKFLSEKMFLHSNRKTINLTECWPNSFYLKGLY